MCAKTQNVLYFFEKLMIFKDFLIKVLFFVVFVKIEIKAI